MIIPHYSAFIRWRLEYHIQFCSSQPPPPPQYKRDATKTVTGLRPMKDKEKLRAVVRESSTGWIPLPEGHLSRALNQTLLGGMQQKYKKWWTHAAPLEILSGCKGGGGKTSSQWEWCSTGIGCPERLQKSQSYRSVVSKVGCTPQGVHKTIPWGVGRKYFLSLINKKYFNIAVFIFISSFLFFVYAL